jgi:hypothetical protein
MRSSVNKKRAEFETIKVSAEAGKAVFSLVEILNYDKLFEENKTLAEENKIYCTEFTKLVFQHEKGQAYLKSIKFNEFIRNPQNLEKYKENKQETDKLIEEWENVKAIYELISKTLQDCDVNFDLENFKDKKYIVISHETYSTIKNILVESIKTLEESLEKFDSFKYSNKTLIKLQNFKVNVCDLHELIMQIEACQSRLENNMLKANVLQKNQDSFMKLKQAEQFYKNLIDFIQENPKFMNLLKVKDSINDILNSLNGVLEDLPYGVAENKNVNNSNSKIKDF